MAPSTPRKRQNVAPNQATITSFFKKAEPTPALPDEIQSGLISVGMRIRKSVPEGYKSGTYAFNKHLPSVGPIMNASSDTEMSSSQESNSSIDSSSSSSASPSKKRTYDIHEDERTAVGESSCLPQPPRTLSAWARSVKTATGAGPGKKNRGFYNAVPRKDIKMSGGEDFGEADFLAPVDQMEE